MTKKGNSSAVSMSPDSDSVSRLRRAHKTQIRMAARVHTGASEKQASGDKPRFVVMAVAGVVLLAMAGLAVGLAVGLNEKDSKSSASAPFAVDIAFTANGNPGDYDDNERATMLGVIATAAGLQLEDAALTVVSGSVIVTASFPIESQSLAQTALTALATNLPNATSLQSALATAGLTVTVLSAPTATTRASTDPVTSGAAPPPSSSPSPSPSPSSTSTVAVAGRWISAYSSFVVTNTMYARVAQRLAHRLANARVLRATMRTGAALMREAHVLAGGCRSASRLGVHRSGTSRSTRATPSSPRTR